MSILSPLPFRDHATVTRAVRPLRLAQALSVTVLSVFAGACAPGVGLEGTESTATAQTAARVEPRESPALITLAIAPAVAETVDTGAARAVRTGATLLRGPCGEMTPFTAEYNSCCEEHAWDSNAGCSLPVGC